MAMSSYIAWSQKLSIIRGARISGHQWYFAWLKESRHPLGRKLKIRKKWLEISVLQPYILFVTFSGSLICAWVLVLVPQICLTDSRIPRSKWDSVVGSAITSPPLSKRACVAKPIPAAAESVAEHAIIAGFWLCILVGFINHFVVAPFCVSTVGTIVAEFGWSAICSLSHYSRFKIFRV